jgi:hypothetical protein
MEHERPELPDPCQAASLVLQESCAAAGMTLSLETPLPADPDTD